MRRRLLEVLSVVAVTVGLITYLQSSVQGQAPAANAKAAAAGSSKAMPRTAWGHPDLQGIWLDEFETPLERPTQYANKELFTDAERAKRDRALLPILSDEQQEVREHRPQRHHECGADVTEVQRGHPRQRQAQHEAAEAPGRPARPLEAAAAIGAAPPALGLPLLVHAPPSCNPSIAACCAISLPPQYAAMQTCRCRRSS